jgi:hypothetical protein
MERDQKRMQRYVRRFVPPESSDPLSPTAAMAIGTLLSALRGFRNSINDVIASAVRSQPAIPGGPRAGEEGYSRFARHR